MIAAINADPQLKAAVEAASGQPVPQVCCNGAAAAGSAGASGWGCCLLRLVLVFVASLVVVHVAGGLACGILTGDGQEEVNPVVWTALFLLFVSLQLLLLVAVKTLVRRVFCTGASATSAPRVATTG